MSEAAKLLIVLEHKNWQEIRERQDLVSDGGQFLKWLIRRLSIPRERWLHAYCYEGNPKDIPSKVWQRREFMEPHMESLVDLMMLNRPCSVVGMGKLAAECLTKGSVLKHRAGTYWGTKPRYWKAGVRHAWITYVPDAALFDPSLFVDITRVLGKAALEANIPIEIDYDLPIYKNWHKYWR